MHRFLITILCNHVLTEKERRACEEGNTREGDKEKHREAGPSLATVD